MGSFIVYLISVYIHLFYETAQSITSEFSIPISNFRTEKAILPESNVGSSPSRTETETAPAIIETDSTTISVFSQKSSFKCKSTKNQIKFRSSMPLLHLILLHYSGLCNVSYILNFFSYPSIIKFPLFIFNTKTFFWYRLLVYCILDWLYLSYLLTVLCFVFCVLLCRHKNHLKVHF